MATAGKGVGVSAKRRKIEEDVSINEDENGKDDARHLCRYESRCFRVSDNEHAHQLENKYESPRHKELDKVTKSELWRHTEISTDANSEDHEILPQCRNGVDCTEVDLVHFAEFWHPTHAEVTEKNGTRGDRMSDSDSDFSYSKGSSDHGEVDECDVVEGRGGWELECTQPISDDIFCEGDEDQGDSTDESNSDFESRRSLPKNDTVLSRGPSIVKCYSILTKEERKELIRRAFELKNLLKDELQRTLDVIEEKNKELRKVHHQLEKGHLMLEGEVEAMEKEELVYFPLFAEREFKERSAAQIHFRLAESQFYRLVDVADRYRVIKVEYVINPILIKRFKAAQDKLRKVRDEKMSYPVLAFHGTKESNIDSICRSGFKMPGDKNFVHATDTGNYGRGVYFSEYPSYSMEYIRGSTKLLLCQVLPGKVYRCTKLILGEPLQEGCDSHTSPDGKELVIFNSSHILPSYVVHYGVAKGDFQYSQENN